MELNTEINKYFTKVTLISEENKLTKHFLGKHTASLCVSEKSTNFREFSGRS